MSSRESGVCEATGRQKHTRDKAQAHLRGLTGSKGCEGTVFRCGECGWWHVAWTHPAGKRKGMRGRSKGRRKGRAQDRAKSRRRREASKWKWT